MALMNRPEMMDAPPAPLLEGDALEPGMVNEAEGALPDEGVASMEDDVSATAKEGDFILPYETILFVGFEEINSLILEAAAAAEQDDIQVEEIDPQDEVPIQISNYEYRVPQELIPYIGMDILNALREKGLEFRAQLEAGRNDAFMERPSEDAEGLGAAMPEIPPQEELPEEALAMPQQALAMPQQAPAMPMMKGGGYVPMQGVGNVDNPGFNNPLQPPTKTMEKQTLDMRGGGLVKKKPIKMVI
jgi:hypothetical protein